MQLRRNTARWPAALAAIALVVPLACAQKPRSDPASPGSEAGSDGASNGSSNADARADRPADDLLFVPGGLANTNLDGDRAGGLKLIAFTLVPGKKGPNLYAAVKNEGNVPICEAGMTTYFVDKSDHVLSSAGSPLQSKQFYRLDGAVIRCVDPGQIAMSAATDLPDEIVIEKLGYLQHRFPAFILNGIVPIGGLSVGDVQTIASDGKSVYTGQLINGFDRTVSQPSVAIFPVNRVGRPLDMAASRTTTDLAPGGSWTFETTDVTDLGVGYVAYATATIPN